MKKSHTTRFLSLFLSLVLSFSLCTPTLADWVDFSDVPSSYWAYDSIMYCSEWNIVTGFEDGTFRPEDKVSSAQFIAMLTRAFYASEVSVVMDTAGQPWYYAYVKAAENAQITKGLAAIDDTPMNRYEMATALNNVMDAKMVVLLVTATLESQYRQGELKERPPVDWNTQKMKAAQQSIKDWDRIPSQYRSAVTQCYALGALTGMSDGKFHGEQSMTRAQACVVITRIIDLMQGETPAAPSQPQQPETPEQTGTGLLANGQEATVENVQAILEDIKREYPEGTSWGEPDIPGTKYYKDGPGYDNTRDVRAIVDQFGAVSLQYGCGGFMAMVSERIFGKTGAPGREVTDISKARPGDIVIKLSSNGGIAHVGIFTSYNSTPNGSFTKGFFYTCDGNTSGGKVCWDLSRDARDVGTRFRIFTRYPD